MEIVLMAWIEALLKKEGSRAKINFLKFYNN